MLPAFTLTVLDDKNGAARDVERGFFVAEEPGDQSVGYAVLDKSCDGPLHGPAMEWGVGGGEGGNATDRRVVLVVFRNPPLLLVAVLLSPSLFSPRPELPRRA